MKPTNVNRRTFLKSAGLAAATAMTARSYAQVPGANERLNTAFIGCGGIAKSSHVPALLKLRKAGSVGILAACDVWETRAREMREALAAGGVPEVKITRDYREVLAMKDVDYVTIASPEHRHARHIIDALAAGKHVYTEKPMTHTVEEGLEVLKAVADSKLQVQVGVQGLSNEGYATAFEAVKAGELGTVVHAQIEYCRWYPPGEAPWRRNIDPKMPKPADLDWNHWLGTAPKREWDASRYHEWRNYRDYSGGISTDLFVHRLSRIIRACGLKAPLRVCGTGGIYMWPDGRELPDNFQMVAEYPAAPGAPRGMTVHVLGTMANRYRYDHAIRGYKGTLLLNKGGWEIQDGAGQVLRSYKSTGAEEMDLHHANLHAAIRKGKPLNCPPELGFHGLLAVRMANLSWFEKRLLAWDDKARKVVPADQMPA